MSQPDPKDYPDRPNEFVRAMRRWQAMRRRPPFPLIPPELEDLFTPLSVQEAKLNHTVDEVRRKGEE